MGGHLLAQANDACCTHVCRAGWRFVAEQETDEQVLAASFETTLAASWITDCARISCACTNLCAQSRMHNSCALLLVCGAPAGWLEPRRMSVMWCQCTY